MEKRKLLGLVLVVVMFVTGLAAGCSSSTPTAQPTVSPTGTAVATATAKPTATSVATATATTTVAPGTKVIELKFADQHPPTNGMNAVVTPGWKKWIETQSNGRIHMSLYYSASAAAPPDLYDAARTGIVDISNQSIGYVKGRFPLAEVGGLPLLFAYPGSESAAYVLNKIWDKYPEIQAQFKDVHFLDFYANGPSHVHTIKKPIHTMADLKGLVLNCSGDQPTVLKALGGTPESLLPTEAYDALSKKVLDGNLLEWEGEVIWHYYEQVNYSTEVGLALSPFIDSMNLNTYNNLPPDLQVLFNRANSSNYAEVQGWLFDNDEVQDRQLINDTYVKRGNPPIYVLPKDERDKWVTAALPIRDTWVKNNASKGPAQAILNDAVAFDAQFRTQNHDWAGHLLATWGAPAGSKDAGTYWVDPTIK